MKPHHKIISIGKFVIAISLLLTVTACHRDFALLDTNGATVGKGNLEVNANSPSPAQFTIDNKNFSGTWSIDKLYESELAKRHRLISSNSYATYMQGNSEDQLKHGHAVLSAADGTQMECDFYYRTQPKFIDCIIGSRTIKMIMSN